jgi:hypothetical protein
MFLHSLAKIGPQPKQKLALSQFSLAKPEINKMMKI